MTLEELLGVLVTIAGELDDEVRQELLDRIAAIPAGPPGPPGSDAAAGIEIEHRSRSLGVVRTVNFTGALDVERFGEDKAVVNVRSGARGAIVVDGDGGTKGEHHIMLVGPLAVEQPI